MRTQERFEKGVAGVRESDSRSLFAGRDNDKAVSRAAPFIERRVDLQGLT
jgi:hypothetical protein